MADVQGFSNYCECSMSLLFCQLFSDQRRHTLTQEQYKMARGHTDFYTYYANKSIIYQKYYNK